MTTLQLFVLDTKINPTQELTSELVQIQVSPPVEVDRFAVVTAGTGHRTGAGDTDLAAARLFVSVRHTLLHVLYPRQHGLRSHLVIPLYLAETIKPVGSQFHTTDFCSY
ncbi:hypothetical protein J6590_054886 [Homalodisca vitripennis]|nr:hypothetical protein J6590_054886 [Homalodisca vitripennis]